MFKFRFMSLFVALVISLFYSSLSYADWTLNKDKSLLTFISFKNEHIAESHSFDSFSGKLSSSGELQISIDLISVETMIPIRNERLKSMLFEISTFSTAVFEAQIDPKILIMPVGTATIMDISGKLTISGKTVDTTFSISLAALSNNSLLATTYKPTLLKMADFGLEPGIEALQKIAKLNSISNTVPLSFSVTFN